MVYYCERKPIIIDALYMSDMDQPSFGDGLLSSMRKVSKLTMHMDNLDQIIDGQPLVKCGGLVKMDS